MDLSNIQTLLPSASPILSTNEIDGTLANEKSRSVKMCYTSYKLMVTFFMFCAIIIYLFVKDMKEDQSTLNILRELIRFGVSANGSQIL